MYTLRGKPIKTCIIIQQRQNYQRTYHEFFINNCCIRRGLHRQPQNFCIPGSCLFIVTLCFWLFCVPLLCLISLWLEIQPAPNLIFNGENLALALWRLLTSTRARTPTLRSSPRRVLFSRSRSPPSGEHDVSASQVADSLSPPSRHCSPSRRLRKHIPNEHLDRNGDYLVHCRCLSPAVNPDDNLDLDGHPPLHHSRLSPVIRPVTPTRGHD